MRKAPLFPNSLEQQAQYAAACSLALEDDVAAERCLQQLLHEPADEGVRAQLTSDLAAIAAARGDVALSVKGFREALALDPACELAKCNLTLLGDDADTELRMDALQTNCAISLVRPRIAVLSLLFNWPSTGGGTVHTKELVEFLRRDGYDVRHFYARQDEWGLGQVAEDLGEHVQPVVFADREWEPETIRNRFRQELDAFAPDHVIITDSWNTKVLLAEAARSYTYFLRIAALECLCPLNNVRLLVENSTIQQCHQHQLAAPHICRQCVATRGRQSGGLHRAERQLAGFELPDYAQRLRRAFAEAAGVLVVNPFIADLVRPHAKQVHVLPSGFDAGRFPQSVTVRRREPGAPLRILFAGLTQELMKGYCVLEEAAALLRKSRQDFEIWVTAEPSGTPCDYVRQVGWQSQDELPHLIAACELMVVPTLAQEALGRTAVEAMGCGRPVVASRLGGLSWVVDDGVTGLLATPGDSADLARQIARLLDDAALRERMGRAGRAKFERELTWDAILPRYADVFEIAKRQQRANGKRPQLSAGSRR